MAVVKVGAATETEMKEKKARVEDALHATRAAVEEGIVPGGGVALIRALPSLDALKFKDDRQYGVNIIRRAVEEPMRQIAANAGAEGSIVVDKVKHGKGGFGFNAATLEYEDLIEAGVIDPTKVVRVALENAASVASLMLMTEALIAVRPQDGAPAGGVRTRDMRSRLDVGREAEGSAEHLRARAVCCRLRAPLRGRVEAMAAASSDALAQKTDGERRSHRGDRRPPRTQGRRGASGVRLDQRRAPACTPCWE